MRAFVCEDHERARAGVGVGDAALGAGEVLDGGVRSCLAHAHHCTANAINFQGPSGAASPAGVAVSYRDAVTTYAFSDDPARLDRARVHAWLSEQAYWALGRARDVQDAAIDGSRNYGVYDADGTQVAYARVVTDCVTFAWLCDVFVDAAVRGQGVGVLLMDGVVDDLDRMHLRRTTLATAVMRELPAPARPLWAAGFLTKIPFYWALDKVSRAHFNRAFYKNYAGWKPSRARHLGQESFAGFTLDRIFPDALQQLRDHKAAGHRVVLLSGALDFLLEPMKDLADDVLCSTLAQENGAYTGELTGAPVAGDARARMLASFARRRGLDLSRSYAYADSISDLPMLEAVGNPVAVNPDAALARIARQILFVAVFRRSERVVERIPAPLAIVPLEHRKIHDPKRAPARF